MEFILPFMVATTSSSVPLLQKNQSDAPTPSYVWLNHLRDSPLKMEIIVRFKNLEVVDGSLDFQEIAGMLHF